MESNKYPTNFEKLKLLNICSNKIYGGGNLIKIDDYIPLIIGNGFVPKIWLYLKTETGVINIVEENHSNNNNVKILIKENIKEVKIEIKGLTILIAKLYEDDKCLITFLDLKPIGINIFGNDNELSVADSIYSNNTFSDIDFLFNIKN
ncbi:hypothetical protein [Myroides odoratimimus]|uniref:Uncharacterized protein n=1 Tax=Myroides odoratimimus CIP 101113 TaxID=883154 RepID=A0AAV3F6W7_9FLAO|nr:hypothetical protein [Myroides odoratimimus]EHO14689.1 hypothetical protein HMPREF9715_00574 [Myroides odoratimimus CIP 101113]